MGWDAAKGVGGLADWSAYLWGMFGSGTDHVQQGVTEPMDRDWHMARGGEERVVEGRFAHFPLD